mmetsp:Transcript_157808/g.278613  ORF Transcript_157808/g.278613 Transcript_157808/m.278613 type:complete len:144 (+) Transcript_157808:80-511(+)
MSKVVLVLVCVAFAGHGGRVHQGVGLNQEQPALASSLNALARLLTLSSTAAFRPSIEAVRSSFRNPANHDSSPVVLRRQNRVVHRAPALRMSDGSQTTIERRDAFKLLDGVEVLRVTDGTTVALNQQWGEKERCALFFFRSWG